jgi:hypothetical protein
MWSFEPASPETRAAIDFLKSYGAPDPILIQHPKPVVDVFSTAPSAVDALLLNELYVFQDRYTENTVSTYIGAVDGWKITLTQLPYLPLPPVPELPSLITPMVQLLFGTCGINALLVVACPPLALRLLRQARAAPGDPNEYTPYPRIQAPPPDYRVIADEISTAPGYFRAGPADHFPNHYIYALNGKSYLKLDSPFGAVWMLLAN